MRKFRKFAAVFFVIYTLFILWLTVFSRTPDYTVNNNRVLWHFHSYHFLIYGFTDIVPNIILNIVLFIPFGFLMSGAIGKDTLSTFIITAFLAFLLSCAIEFTQLYFSLGMFELDDIVNNTLGSAIGFLIFKFIKRKTECAK